MVRTRMKQHSLDVSQKRKHCDVTLLTRRRTAGGLLNSDQCSHYFCTDTNMHKHNQKQQLIRADTHRFCCALGFVLFKCHH